MFKPETSRDSLEGPLFKDSSFPLEGAWDLSLVEELGFHILWNNNKKKTKKLLNTPKKPETSTSGKMRSEMTEMNLKYSQLRAESVHRCVCECGDEGKA